MRRVHWLGALCVLASSAWALQLEAAAPAATAPAPAHAGANVGQLARMDAEMSQAAQKAAQMVAAGQAGVLWDGASAVAKKAVSRENFIRQLVSEQARLGTVVSRGTATVSRVKYAAGASVPEGVYANVITTTRYANIAQPVRELVSFRLDEDQVWRLSGYHLRIPN